METGKVYEVTQRLMERPERRATAVQTFYRQSGAPLGLIFHPQSNPGDDPIDVHGQDRAGNLHRLDQGRDACGLLPRCQPLIRSGRLAQRSSNHWPQLTSCSPGL